jgi:putative hydrolase of HD superfamily
MVSSLMEFFHAAERLKTELRHAHKSNGQRESVAEHSWRLCLMTMFLSETIEGIDRNKCLKMALIHDLPEIFAGDAYRLDLKKQAGRHDKERAALEKLVKLLAEGTAGELTQLWLEFEEGTTGEARLVRLIDRLEVLVQHNESDLGKWSELEMQIQYGLAAKHAERYGFMREFALEIDQETKEKLNEAGRRPQRLTQKTYDMYYGDSGPSLA